MIEPPSKRATPTTQPASTARALRRVLIANRGEIAVRIIRALHELGLEAVAVYSEADRSALHVRLADAAVPIGRGPSAESYLRTEAIIGAARAGRCDAIHPGYGFLSENPELAAATELAGLAFIGPPAAAIRRMGNKLEAHAIARAAGVPLIPSSDGALEDLATAQKIARAIGYPIMLKAAAGGGGKGMRVVADAEAMASAFDLVRGEARSAFGNDLVYIEKLVGSPRHVEIQVLADTHGNIVHLGERDCSIQRRHQKVIEETPSPVCNADLRAAMGTAAIALTRAVDYVNAATVEFLVDSERNFYFLEMNTRLQVEHPITEAVTGIDIVKQQLHIAAGGTLDIRQDQVHPRGAAMEFRIYAEDPTQNFLPSLGTIRRLRLPSGPGVRNDAGIYPGYAIPIYYDPMIAKLVVWGRDRQEARLRAVRALSEYLVVGVRTNLPFHRWVVEHERFVAGDTHTGFIAEQWNPARVHGRTDLEQVAMMAAAVAALGDRHRATGAPGGSGAAPQSRWRFQGRPGGSGV